MSDDQSRITDEDDVHEVTTDDVSSQSQRAPTIYRLYVLVVLFLIYMLNQLDRYMLGIVTKPMSQELHYGDEACMKNESAHHVPGDEKFCNASTKTDCEMSVDSNGTFICKWDYTGQGFEYELLAGPVFIVVYSFVGIPLGAVADASNRKNLLTMSLLLWSAMALLSGFVTQYWQLVITRFVLGIGQAGCTPFAASLIADYFSEAKRAAALGFYNWGIYMGYSMSYALGNAVTLSLGWRWAWIISGIPGLVLGLVAILTVKEPTRQMASHSDSTSVNNTDDLVELRWYQKLARACHSFLQPSLFLLCIAGSVRNAAGYVWAYNTQIYFQAIGESPQTIATYMSWIPVVWGSVGVVLGGYISDRVVKRVGLYARVLVLTASQVLAAPFVAGALFLNPPYAYLSLIPGYIFGEMWVGITMAVALELVPSYLRTFAIAVYMFIISNIGGNMPLLVPPLKAVFKSHGYSDVASFRGALAVLYPGLYVLGALLFLSTVATLCLDLRRPRSSGYQPVPQDEH